MQLTTNRSVEIALRVMRPEERRHVQSWFDHLKNWDNDSHVRKISRQLPDKDDVYVLATGEGILIFFHKEADSITVLDLARKETIDQFAKAE